MHLSLLILVFTATAVPMGACLPFAVDKRPNKDTGAHDQHLISTSMSKVDGVHNICCCYGGVGSWAVSEWLVYHFLAIVVARLILVLRVVRLFFFLVCLYTHIYLGAFFFVLWRQLNEPENPPPPLCLYILPLTRRVWPVCFCLCSEGPGGRDCFVNTLWKTDTDRGHKNGPDRASA